MSYPACVWQPNGRRHLVCLQLPLNGIFCQTAVPSGHGSTMQVPRTIAIVAKVSRPGLPSIEAPRRIRAHDLARPEHAKICASQSQRRQQPWPGNTSIAGKYRPTANAPSQCPPTDKELMEVAGARMIGPARFLSPASLLRAGWINLWRLAALTAQPDAPV